MSIPLLILIIAIGVAIDTVARYVVQDGLEITMPLYHSQEY